jgi:hypothetical protein
VSSGVLISSEVNIESGITLTDADCALTPPDTINRKPILNPETVADPAGGSDQYWDYSNLAVDLEASARVSTFDPVTGDTTFPMANVAQPGGSTTLPGLVVPLVRYASYDENGKVELGWISEAVEFSLEPLTGNPDDKLSFKESATIYEMPHVEIEYPASYGQSWVSDHSGSLNWDATIAFAGLTDTPSSGVSYCHQEGEVIGWGTLRLPNGPDGALNEFEALLIEDTETCIDSFFTFGMPTPDALLAGFGIVQGRSDTRTSYRFFAKGLKSEILSIDRFENAGVVDSDVTISAEVDLATGITLTAADCALTPPDTIVRQPLLNPETILDPTEGADQYWDYSNLEVDLGAGMRISTFDPLTGDTTFPMANVTQPSGVSTLPGLVVPRLDYRKHDENGKVELGWISEAVEFSLEPLTGNPDDKLSFNASTSEYEMPHIDIEYPASYGQSWVSDHGGTLNWDATIAFAGLTDAPSAGVSYCH